MGEGGVIIDVWASDKVQNHAIDHGYGSQAQLNRNLEGL